MLVSRGGTSDSRDMTNWLERNTKWQAGIQAIIDNPPNNDDDLRAQVEALCVSVGDPEPVEAEYIIELRRQIERERAGR